jgi:hypothetical protein
MAVPEALEDGSGGLQQQRHPGIVRRRPARNHAPEQLDLLGLGLDDGDPAAETVTLGSLLPLNPVVAARAVNDGAGRDGSPLPSF